MTFKVDPRTVRVKASLLTGFSSLSPHLFASVYPPSPDQLYNPSVCRLLPSGNSRHHLDMSTDNSGEMSNIIQRGFTFIICDPPCENIPPHGFHKIIYDVI